MVISGNRSLIDIIFKYMTFDQYSNNFNGLGSFYRKIPWHHIYNLFINKNVNSGHPTYPKHAFVSVRCTNEFSWSFMTLFNLYPQTNATITIIIIINTDLWLIRDHPNQLRAILVNTHALAWHYQRLEIIGCAQH